MSNNPYSKLFEPVKIGPVVTKNLFSHGCMCFWPQVSHTATMWNLIEPVFCYNWAYFNWLKKLAIRIITHRLVIQY